ncbi:hypothetical protein V6C16_07690 [Desulfovibrio sp. 1188_IL3213]|uniref:hypothetical protein n=1 Tax=Desulfovibrio sp. 1188_IL3213 TaxID=3084052 RepID=UPI002FDB47C8
MSYIAFLVGILFLVWGTIRMSTDFKSNKRENNIIQLIFTGQASGIGQFFSGIIFIIIGIVSLLVQ